MKKKRVLIVALVICLLAILSYGTLAWFTAEDEVTNTFTIGSVDIEVVEDFVPPEAMIPVVDTANPESDPNFVNKDASVKNTGKNPAYVQMFVAVPKALDDAGAFHYVEANTIDWTKQNTVSEATIEGVLCNVYCYRYNGVLASEVETSDVITGAYLDAALDLREVDGVARFVMGDTVITDYTVGEVINVYVAAQAIQSEGFADADSALNTFANHPWA